MELGLPELLIVLAIVLLLFGSSRLPKLSRSVGESLRELRSGLTGTESAANKNTANKDKQSTSKTKA